MGKIYFTRTSFVDGKKTIEPEIEVDREFYENWISIDAIRFFRQFGKSYRSRKSSTWMGYVFTHTFSSCGQNWTTGDFRFEF